MVRLLLVQGLAALMAAAVQRRIAWMLRRRADSPCRQPVRRAACGDAIARKGPAMLRLSAAVCLLFAAISPVLAQPAPPAEAVAACAGKTVGTAVTFTGPRGDLVAATCRERNGRLAAAPDVPPPE